MGGSKGHRHGAREIQALDKRGYSNQKERGHHHEQRWKTIFSSTYFWWEFNQETPNWQINWQHQKHRQKTDNSLITVMIKATADCRNVHSKCLLWIRIWELSFIMLSYRSWWIYLPTFTSSVLYLQSCSIEVIHISVIFARNTVYSRFLKEQHACWTSLFQNSPPNI